MTDELVFAEESSTNISDSRLPWKILIVDDDVEIHEITKLALSSFMYDGGRLEFISAYTGAEANEIIANQPDIAVMLLDVVMETDDAGLRVVEYVRDQLKNTFVRIILRTGQPGQAPEKKVIIDYDINDYKSKSELTSQKLFSAVISAIRGYQDLMIIEGNRETMEYLVTLVPELFTMVELSELTKRTNDIFSVIVNGFQADLSSCDSFVMITHQESNQKILEGGGKYSGVSKVSQDVLLRNLNENLQGDIRLLFQTGEAVTRATYQLFPLKSDTAVCGCIYFESGQLLEGKEHVLKVFSHQVAMAIEHCHLQTEIKKLSKLKQYFTPAVNDQILTTDSEDFGDLHEQSITVVNIELRNLSQTTLDKKDQYLVIQEFYKEMGEVVFQYEATINHFISTGLMVIIGDPFPDDNHADNALMLCSGIRSSFVELKAKWDKKWGIQLDLGLGIASGVALLGDLGVSESFHYSVIGDVSDISSHLGMMCEPGQILLAESTYDALNNKTLFDIKPVVGKSKLYIKGKHTGIVLFNF
jgi:class 3 adenylate cyclase/CheY-like chemotaxis protein